MDHWSDLVEQLFYSCTLKSSDEVQSVIISRFQITAILFTEHSYVKGLLFFSGVEDLELFRNYLLPYIAAEFSAFT